MALIEVGRVCVKKLGRDAGSRAIITKVLDGNFVNVVTSIRSKDRKCNIKHLELLSEKVDVSDKERVKQVLSAE